MKCLVCNCELPDGASKCPRDGFLVMMTADPDSAELRAMADAYRLEQINGMEVSATVYSWKEREDSPELELAGEQEVTLAACKDLTPNVVSWLSEEFAPDRHEDAFDLTVSIGRKDGTRKRLTVRMDAPKTQGNWQIGAVKSDRGILNVCVGDGKNYVLSEELDPW